MKKRLFALTMVATIAFSSIGSVNVFAASDSKKEITVNIGDQAAFFLFKVAEKKDFWKMHLKMITLPLTRKYLLIWDLPLSKQWQPATWI